MLCFCIRVVPFEKVVGGGGGAGNCWYWMFRIEGGVSNISLVPSSTF